VVKETINTLNKIKATKLIERFMEDSFFRSVLVIPALRMEAFGVEG
jgi:hypothetical protein